MATRALFFCAKFANAFMTEVKLMVESNEEVRLEKLLVDYGKAATQKGIKYGILATSVGVALGIIMVVLPEAIKNRKKNETK